MKKYNVKKYIKVKNGKVVDTTLLLPHVECYFIEDNKLYFESTSGDEMYLGQVIVESDNLSDLAEVKQ